MGIKRDPVETTEEYAKAMEKINLVLEKEFPKDQWYMGTCHRYWCRQKELLKEAGIDWHTPAEMNPNAKFD